jgi:hypothetical protein
MRRWGKYYCEFVGVKSMCVCVGMDRSGKDSVGKEKEKAKRTMIPPI